MVGVNNLVYTKLFRVGIFRYIKNVFIPRATKRVVKSSNKVVEDVIT